MHHPGDDLHPRRSPLRIAVAILVILALASCAGGKEGDGNGAGASPPDATGKEDDRNRSGPRKIGPPEERDERGSGPVMAAPEEVASRCKAALSRSVCPASAPRIEEGTPVRAQSFSQVKGHRLVSFEWSAPYPGITPRNSPPRFAHLVLQAGHGTPSFPFEVSPARRSDSMRLASRRREALELGRPSWGRHEGTLLLAPSYPDGGVHGDHLVYLWRDASKTYAVSLHAWPPLNEAKATLRAVVQSTEK